MKWLLLSGVPCQYIRISLSDTRLHVLDAQNKKVLSQ